MILTKEELMDLIVDNALLPEDIDEIIQALKLKKLIENEASIDPDEKVESLALICQLLLKESKK